MAISKVKAPQLKSRVTALKTFTNKRAAILRQANSETQKILNRRLKRKDFLRRYRERVAAKIRKENQTTVVVSQNVLNEKTQDFLIKHSLIDAPTLTSIFAGFELARASRADRLDRARELEISRIETNTKLLQEELDLADKTDTLRQRAIESDLNANTTLLNDLLKAREQDVEDFNQQQRDVFRQEQDLEEIGQRFENQQTLQDDRQSFSQSERLAGQAFSSQQQEDRQTFQTNERIARQQEQQRRDEAGFGGRRRATNTQDFNDFIDSESRRGPDASPSFNRRQEDDLAPGIETDIGGDTTDQEAVSIPPAGITPGINPLEEEPLVDDPQQPLIGDVVVDNELPSPIIGEVLESREAFDTLLAQDQEDQDTVDVAVGFENDQLEYYENPETGEVTVVAAGQGAPDGFVKVEDFVV
jgi:hypothetical protein